MPLAGHFDRIDRSQTRGGKREHSGGRALAQELVKRRRHLVSRRRVERLIDQVQGEAAVDEPPQVVEAGGAETMVDLGEPVKKGGIVARIHGVGRTGLAPQELRAKMDGLLAARHFPGLVKAGDCVSVIAVELA